MEIDQIFNFTDLCFVFDTNEVDLPAGYSSMYTCTSNIDMLLI